MTRPSRSLAYSLLGVVALAPLARPAFAQATPPGTVVIEPGYDHEAFCRDHWFAVWQCRERGWRGPELMLGADLGVSAMNEHGPFGFNNGVGTVTSPGPAWGVRVGVEFFPWLALEARYLSMYNAVAPSVSPTGSVGFLTTGGAAVLRLTAPLPFVHPYIFGGAGYYDVALVGPSGSELHSSSQWGLPMGFGFDVPLTWYFSVGAEATYHYQIQETYSAVTLHGIDGGDLSTFNAVLRVRL